MTKHIEKIARKFQEYQELVCTMIEQSDCSARFSKDLWEKEVGYGISRIISGGDKIEKGAINFSKVSGPVNKKVSKTLGVNAKWFSATGLSSIFHGNNPFIPTIHMNVRYFNLHNGMEWFGGGIDLSPVYIDIEQTKKFHFRLKEICDKFNKDFYPEFKNRADEYFFLEHRKETRGVGGIFFDRQQPTKDFDTDKWLGFELELLKLYPLLYKELLELNCKKTYTEQNKIWQKIRRGRYVEFNLIYDLGTKFGLESNGNIESILVSLPLEAGWVYNFLPEVGSEEEKTQKMLRKGIDWINLPEN
jgi:coproporphyrinogen III oxidase